MKLQPFVVGLLHIGASLGSTDFRRARLETAVDVLEEQFFSPTQGAYPSAIDWTAATIFTVLGQVFELTGSHRYFSHLISFYYCQNVTSLRTQAYDDMQWVVLCWLQAARYAKGVEIEWVQPFQARARELYGLASAGWDESNCDGGMLWRRDGIPYKNSITNELFITTSIELYLEFPQQAEYIDNAIKAWSWMSASRLKNRWGLWADGVHDCTDIDATVWTYNQGVILSGLVGLFSATGKATFLEEGHALIRSVMGSPLVRDGILFERCDPAGACSQNSLTFKGIFFRHMLRFCQVANCTRYVAFVDRNAEAAWNTRGPTGVIGDHWASWPSLRSVETHAGGVALLSLSYFLSPLEI